MMMMRKIFFFLLPLIFSLQSPPKVFAVVQKWPVKLHSNSSVSLEGGESNNILLDSDVTTIYNKLTVYADADFDFSTEFELAAKSLEELEVDVFEHEISQSSPPPPLPPPSPPPPPTCTKCIPAASWHAFVAECLAEAPVTGECTTWASGNNYGTMPNWDTSLVTDMSGIDGTSGQGFGYKSTVNGDISKWNTEKVTDMGVMFFEASAFKQAIGSWNTAEVTAMNGMFRSASAFNHDISSWTGSAATTAQTGMFYDATAFQAKFTCTDAVTGPARSCFERLVNLETCSVLYEAISPVLPFLKAATVDFPADHSTFGSNYAYYVYAEITTGSTFNSYEDVYLLGGTSHCGSWFGGLYHGRPFIGTQCNWGSSTAVGVDQTTATVALQANQTYRIQWMYNVAEGYRRAQIKVDGVVVVDSTTAYLNVDSSSTEEFLSIGSGYHTQVSETLQGSVKKVSVHICGENI
jgi:surface protein